MSNEIKEECDHYEISMKLPRDPILERECGLSLKGLKRGDAQIEALFAVAKETGSATILSRMDVLQKADRFMKDARALIAKMRTGK